MSITFKNRCNHETHKLDSTSIQRQIQVLNPEIGFNVNSIQRRIQPLNPQIGFNVYSIQRPIQPLNP